MTHHLGATGRFPQGKLSSDDQGELRMAVVADPIHKKVVISFGKEITWIGFDMAQAAELGELLIEKSKQLRMLP